MPQLNLGNAETLVSLKAVAQAYETASASLSDIDAQVYKTTTQGLTYYQGRSKSLYNMALPVAFSNALTVGQLPPSTSVLSRAYNPYVNAGNTFMQNTTYFSADPTGLQTLKAPTYGTYEIVVGGAQGGSNALGVGGSGALIATTMTLKQGQAISVAVGQQASFQTSNIVTGPRTQMPRYLFPQAYTDGGDVIQNATYSKTYDIATACAIDPAGNLIIGLSLHYTHALRVKNLDGSPTFVTIPGGIRYGTMRAVLLKYSSSGVFIAWAVAVANNNGDNTVREGDVANVVPAPANSTVRASMRHNWYANDVMFDNSGNMYVLCLNTELTLNTAHAMYNFTTASLLPEPTFTVTGLSGAIVVKYNTTGVAVGYARISNFNATSVSYTPPDTSSLTSRRCIPCGMAFDTVNSKMYVAILHRTNTNLDVQGFNNTTASFTIPYADSRSFAMTAGIVRFDASTGAAEAWTQLNTNNTTTSVFDINSLMLAYKICLCATSDALYSAHTLQMQSAAVSLYPFATTSVLPAANFITPALASKCLVARFSLTTGAALTWTVAGTALRNLCAMPSGDVLVHVSITDGTTAIANVPSSTSTLGANFNATVPARYDAVVQFASNGGPPKAWVPVPTVFSLDTSDPKHPMRTLMVDQRSNILIGLNYASNVPSRIFDFTSTSTPLQNSTIVLPAYAAQDTGNGMVLRYNGNNAVSWAFVGSNANLMSMAMDKNCNLTIVGEQKLNLTSSNLAAAPFGGGATLSSVSGNRSCGGMMAVQYSSSGTFTAYTDGGSPAYDNPAIYTDVRGVAAKGGGGGTFLWTSGASTPVVVAGGGGGRGGLASSVLFDNSANPLQMNGKSDVRINIGTFTVPAKTPRVQCTWGGRVSGVVVGTAQTYVQYGYGPIGPFGIMEITTYVPTTYRTLGAAFQDFYDVLNKPTQETYTLWLQFAADSVRGIVRVENAAVIIKADIPVLSVPSSIANSSTLVYGNSIAASGGAGGSGYVSGASGTAGKGGTGGTGDSNFVIGGGGGGGGTLLSSSTLPVLGGTGAWGIAQPSTDGGFGGGGGGGGASLFSGGGGGGGGGYLGGVGGSGAPLTLGGFGSNGLGGTSFVSTSALATQNNMVQSATVNPGQNGFAILALVSSNQLPANTYRFTDVLSDGTYTNYSLADRLALAAVPWDSAQSNLHASVYVINGARITTASATKASFDTGMLASPCNVSVKLFVGAGSTVGIAYMRAPLTVYNAGSLSNVTVNPYGTSRGTITAYSGNPPTIPVSDTYPDYVKAMLTFDDAQFYDTTVGASTVLPQSALTTTLANTSFDRTVRRYNWGVSARFTNPPLTASTATGGLTYALNTAVAPPLTVAMWVYPRVNDKASGTDPYTATLLKVYSSTNAALPGMSLRIESGFYKAYVGDYVSAQIVATLNTWAHVVLVQGSTATDVTVYINGLALTMNKQNLNIPAASFNRLALGYDAVSNTQGYSGNIDSVQFYNARLTAAQIAEAYAA